MTTKKHVYGQCTEVLNQKITHCRKVLADLKESAANETKSTAGDKHETALAMLQIEQENTGRQLDNLLNQLTELSRVDINTETEKVAKGSLVKTNRGYIFIAVGLGKITIKNTAFYVSSVSAPLAKKLLGLQKHDTTSFNGLDYQVEDIQ